MNYPCEICQYSCNGTHCGEKNCDSFHSWELDQLRGELAKAKADLALANNEIETLRWRCRRLLEERGPILLVGD